MEDLMCNYGGFLPLSMVDYPSHSACVVFLRGCPGRCPNCINKDLQDGKNMVSTEWVLDRIDEAAKFVSAVVISGGECLMQSEAVQYIAAYSQDIGLKVGIETAGLFPESLESVLPHVDRVLLSIKCKLNNVEYMTAMGVTMQWTGLVNFAGRVQKCLDVLDSWDGEVEFITPIFQPDIECMRHAIVDLDNHISSPRTWKLVPGLYPNKEQKPISKVELRALASSINSYLAKSNIKVIT